VNAFHRAAVAAGDDHGPQPVLVLAREIGNAIVGRNEHAFVNRQALGPLCGLEQRVRDGEDGRVDLGAQRVKQSDRLRRLCGRFCRTRGGACRRQGIANLPEIGKTTDHVAQGERSVERNDLRLAGDEIHRVGLVSAPFERAAPDQVDDGKAKGRRRAASGGLEFVPSGRESAFQPGVLGEVDRGRRREKRDG